MFLKVKITQKIDIPFCIFSTLIFPFLRGSHLQCFLECSPVFSFCNDKQIYVAFFFFFSNCSPVTQSTCSAGDARSVTGLGRSPGGGNGNPLKCSCLKNLMDRGAWQATVERVAISWPRLSSSISIVSIICIYRRLFSQGPTYGYYLGCFQYFVVKMMLQWITLEKYIFIFLGGIYLQDKFLEVRLLGWRVNVYVVFVRCCLITLHNHYAINIWIHTSNVWESLIPHSHIV